MITNDLITMLKQTNISMDIEKTKERVKMLWKSASKKNKDAVCSIANVKLTTIYRAYKMGSLSAKLCVAMSSVLNVDPFYLSGETDTKGSYSDDVLEAFLLSKNYKKQLAKYKDAHPEFNSQYQIESIFQPEPVISEPDDEPGEEPSPALRSDLNLDAADQMSPKMQAYANSLSEEELIILFKAIMIRSKIDEDADKLASTLKKVLLS